MSFPSVRLLTALLALSAAGLYAQTPSPKIILSEDFESTAVGEIPKGFTKTGALGVVDDVAHSGKKSLRIEPATRGARVITLTGDKLTALGGEHWGRLYYKVKLPIPTPAIPEGKTSGLIHSTLVSGKATSPLANDPIEVRMLGNILNMNGTFKYIFNVQPSKRKEFGNAAKTPLKFTDEWTLAEWYVDNATQSYRLFINGDEIPELAVHKGEGQYEGAEIPAVFNSLSFGWNNYQAAAGGAADGFTAWIDDIALGKERLGK
jgi:hypothetical protein